MMSGDEIKISDETFSKLGGKQGLLFIPEINGIINLNSVVSILPKKLLPNQYKNGDIKICNDGTRAYNKFGLWVLENNQDIKIDLNYYPELKEAEVIDPHKLEEPSKFSKGLLN